jgi:LIVCS family branched-chain amino acid:cation transporter
LVLGPYAGVLANVTIAVACISTAIALTAVFANYLTHELFLGRVDYFYALLITVSAIFAMTNLGFFGIAQVIEPVVVRLYPALIVLSIANIAHVAWGFKQVKPLVFGTFLLTLIFHYLM